LIRVVCPTADPASLIEKWMVMQLSRVERGNDIERKKETDARGH
jgi:hypothetical protein